MVFRLCHTVYFLESTQETDRVPVAYAFLNSLNSLVLIVLIGQPLSRLVNPSLIEQRLEVLSIGDRTQYSVGDSLGNALVAANVSDTTFA